jgi:hypothetical protein
MRISMAAGVCPIGRGVVYAGQVGQIVAAQIISHNGQLSALLLCMRTISTAYRVAPDDTQYTDRSAAHQTQGLVGVFRS